MLRGVALACLLSVVAGGTTVSAQTATQIVSPILIVNQDRIIAESDAGAEAQAAFEEAARVLAEENDRIEAELIEEERALTEERPDLPVDEFRARADDFDARVQRIRAEQDQKARAIQLQREEARLEVIRSAGSVIREISLERGAILVLDQRNVVLSADAIDITDEVIARIDDTDETPPQ